MECFAAVEDHSNNGALVGIAEREAPDAGKLGAAAALDGGADSSPTIDPLFEGVAASGPDVMALVLRWWQVGLSQDSFT